MKNFKIIITYDGTQFFGWQKNGAFRTPQAEIEKALSIVLQQPVDIEGASRTDRGVHANGQCASFKAPKTPCLKSLNSLLPKDVQLLALEEAPLSFHPSFSSKKKRYLYKIYNGNVLLPHLARDHWHVEEPLDLRKMREAAKELRGKRDFRPFTNAKKGETCENFERELFHCEVSGMAPFLTIELEGDRFLYKMARNLVGYLVMVGSGKFCAEIGKTREELPMTAPAHGLILDRVFY